MEGRQAPYNMSAEQAVLGCMISNSKALSEVFTEIKADDFYTEAHRLIFEAIKSLLYRPGGGHRNRFGCARFENRNGGRP